MAKRNRRKRGARVAKKMAELARSEVIGIILLVLAAFTLLSLLSPRTAGPVTWWLNALKRLVGFGVYALPLVFGLSGAWLVWRRVAVDREVPLRRPAGVFILFLVLITAVHLLVGGPDRTAPGVDSAGGGLLGWAVSEALRWASGLAGAGLVLFLLFLAGCFLVWGISWEQFWDKVQDAIRSIQDRRALTLPDTPLPSGRIPFWRRWMSRTSPERSAPQPTELHAAAPARSVVSTSPVESSRQAVEPRLFPKLIGGDREWQLPRIEEILEESVEQEISRDDLRRRARIIEETLAGFGVPVKVVEANQGPAVTQFGLKPGTVTRRSRDGQTRESRVKVSQIARLSNDLALALAASPIRIETPVPGRDVVGVEVPNPELSLVSLGAVMQSDTFRTKQGTLKIGLGRDVSGSPAVADLALMPHLLIAGATGSGKSVCINAIVACLLCTHTPRTLRLVMVDPKMVELTMYNGIPHLVTPVVVELERVVNLLKWATREMDRRFRLFNRAGVRHVDGYNEMLVTRGETILPYIVVVIDELADLMMVAADEVERHICRLAQMARATGIHLVIATQRPSIDVVTGLIKANFPARIAFAVATQVDSRVILDQPGAERLLGRGDMLLMTSDSSKLVRLQGCYVSDRELGRLVRFWTEGRQLDVESEQVEPMLLPPQEMFQQPLWEGMLEGEDETPGRDDLYEDAVRVVREVSRASASLLQRRLRIGYSRAARLVEALEADGVVGPPESAGRSRIVLPPPPPIDEG